jgi:DNA-binding ferritin-like protein
MQTNNAIDDYQALAQSIETAMENATQSGDHATATALSAILRSIVNRDPNLGSSRHEKAFPPT